MDNSQNIIRVHLILHLNAKCLAGKLIKDSQHLVTASITQLVMNKIEGANMIDLPAL